MNVEKRLVPGQEFVHMRAVVARSGIVAAVTFGLLSGGCVTCCRRAGPDQCAAPDAVLEVLHDQNDAWNRGDIDAFMEGYWKSPELTFVSGGKVTKGWQPTLEGYKKRYPDRATMGTLTFSELNVRVLARDAALVSGRWHLKRHDPIGGRFTLLFRLQAGKWVIVYDHTSVGAGEPAA